MRHQAVSLGVPGVGRGGDRSACLECPGFPPGALEVMAMAVAGHAECQRNVRGKRLGLLCEFHLNKK